ncbi:MAG: PD-(D/E)XK nuclease family protein [Firmicutes bacterium]|nr:PD-(D/E)XK nuclease family protein [Bacillota bacterium]
MGTTLLKSDNLGASIEGVIKLARESAKSGLNPTWVLVPDRFTLECEKLLLKDESGMPCCLLNTRVITFSMLFNIIKTELGDDEIILDKTRAVLYIWRAITDVAGDLCWFKGSGHHYTFAEKMFNTINQLTSSLVDFDKLETNATTDITRKKMHDIALIYRRYKQLTTESIDASGMLGYLIKNLQSSKLIKQAKIFVCGFDHLSIQRLSVLEQVLLNCLDFVTGIQIESEGEFQIREVLFRNNIQFKEIARNCRESSSPLGILPFVCGHKNINDEGAFIANRVRGFLNNGTDPNDIVVLLCDYDNTHKIYEEIFNSCNIAVNMDVGLALLDTPLAMYLRDLIALAIHDSTENFLSILKSNFIKITTDELFKIENMCLKTNSGLFKTDYFEELKNNIKKLRSCKNVYDICEILLEFLKAIQIDDKIDHISGEKLEKLVSIIGDSLCYKKMELREFKMLFETLASATKVSGVPTFCDRVLIANAKEYQPHVVKNIIIANVCEGTFPITTNDTDILTETDIRSMNIIIEPTATMQNNRARTHAWNILNSASQSLCVCHISVNTAGEEVFRGEIVEQLLQQKTQNNTSNLNKYGVELNSHWVAKRYVLQAIGTGMAFLDQLYFASILKSLDLPSLSVIDLKKNEMNITCGKELFPSLLSVTQIETFYVCPFMHFLTRGLKVRPRDRYKVSANIIGNIIHKIVEEFTLDLIAKYQGGQVRNIAKIVDQVLGSKEFSWFACDDLHLPLVQGLRKEAIIICNKIEANIEQSQYKPRFVERSLNSDIITGKADRVDTTIIDGQEYAIVIDYKTGSVVEFKPVDLYIGAKLQLPLYLKLLEADGFKMGGGFYFHLKSGFTKDERMKGLVLNSDENVIAIDRGLEDGGYRSNIIQVRRTSKGVISGGYDADKIRDLVDYADSMAHIAQKHITNGVIIKSSTDNKACGYCVNSATCLFKDKIRSGL